MTSSPGHPFTRKRAPAIALTIALHLGLLLLWRATGTPRPPPTLADDQPAIAWIRVPVRPTAPTQPPPPQPVRHAPSRPSLHESAPAIAATPVPPVLEAPLPAPATAPPAEGVLQRALRDVGKIDKDLRKESPGGRIVVGPPTTTAKLVAGIEKATRLPKYWEAPRIETVQDQGGYDRRIYKVTTANGVYCIYQESNHAPDGLDVIKNGTKQKVMTCPREE